MDSNCQSGLCWPVVQQVVYVLECTQVIAMLLTSSTDCLLAVMLPIRYRSRVPHVLWSLNEISKSQTSWSRVYNCGIRHLQVPPFNTSPEKWRRLSQNRECKIMITTCFQADIPFMVDQGCLEVYLPRVSHLHSWNYCDLAEICLWQWFEGDYNFF